MINPTIKGFVMGMYDDIIVKEDIRLNNVLIEKGCYQTKDLGELMEVYQLDGLRLLNTQQGFMSRKTDNAREPQFKPTEHTCTIRMYGKRDGIEYMLTFLNGILVRVSLFLWDEEYAEYLEQTTKNADKQKTVSDIVNRCGKLIDKRLERYLAEGALDKHQLLLVNRNNILDIVSVYEKDIRNKCLISDERIISDIIPHFIEGAIRMSIT